MIERALNIIWILLGLGTIVNAWSLGLFGSMGPDSGLFPMLCGVTITICGLFLLFSVKKNSVENPEWPRGNALARVLGVIAGLVAMALTLPFLGFAISSALTTFALLQTVERSRLLESVLLTVVSVAFIMFIFDHLLGMTLPRSPWGW